MIPLALPPKPSASAQQLPQHPLEQWVSQLPVRRRFHPTHQQTRDAGEL